MSERRRITRQKKLKNMAEEDSDQSQYTINEKKEKIKRWSLKENESYIKFLIDHRDQFDMEKGRKRKNLFKKMANQIDCNKDNQQCRTHHEKKMKKYGNVDEIIANHTKNPNNNTIIEKKNEEKQSTSKPKIAPKKSFSFGAENKTEENQESRVMDLQKFIDIAGGVVKQGQDDDDKPPPLNIGQYTSYPDFMQFITPEIRQNKTPAQLFELLCSRRSPLFKNILFQ